MPQPGSAKEFRVAVALNDQALAVMFDLVDPFRPVRHLRRLGRNAGFEFLHMGYLGRLVSNTRLVAFRSRQSLRLLQRLRGRHLLDDADSTVKRLGSFQQLIAVVLRLKPHDCGGHADFARNLVEREG
jgi:hypothetical protein